MKPLIAILTGLHVLAHGVFGCCDHGPVITARAESACACHHAHHHVDEAVRAGAGDAVERDSPIPAPHECVHDACHWVVGGDGPSMASLDLAAPALIDCVALPTQRTLQAAEYQPDDILGRTSAPPLRLHLALGVLVV